MRSRIVMRSRSIKRFAFALAVVAVAGTEAHPQDDVILEWIGASSSGRLGNSVGFAGDVDGDGYSDVLLGNPFPTNPTDPGEVFLHSGRTGALIWSLSGNQSSDHFGSSVAGLGDTNLDGIPDVAVGSLAGYVKILSGSDGSLLRELTSSTGSTTYGGAICSIGDFNLDGRGDVIVGDPGANSSAGVVYYVSGKTGATLLTLPGENANDRFGSVLAPAGDCDDDGVPDLSVAAVDWPNGTKNGRVYVYSGPNGNLHFRRDGVSGEKLGYGLGTAGDVNQDGHDDLIVGGRTNFDGEAMLLSGADGSQLYFWSGGNGTRLGDSVAPAGDVDHDGFLDIAVGAPRDDASATSHGAVYIYSGSDGSVLRRTLINGDADWGQTLAGGVDGNGDGNVDLLVGGPFTLGGVVLLSIALRPDIISVSPARGRYTGGTQLTIQGDHFNRPGGASVTIGGAAATNVIVVDDDTITCETPRTVAGEYPQIKIQTDIGERVRDGAYLCTPAMLEPTGDLWPDGFVINTFLCEPGDTIYSIYGIDPGVIPIPPFDGAFGIDPYVVLGIEPAWPFDTYVRDDAIPDDSTLSGLTILCQALIGPKLAGKNRDGATTNVVSFVIQ